MVERKMKISGNWIVVYVRVCTCMYSMMQLLTSYTYMYDLGFVSNGEYNSMRVKGYTRPLQIRSEAREVLEYGSEIYA
jgi:hypothetical protein